MIGLIIIFWVFCVFLVQKGATFRSKHRELVNNNFVLLDKMFMFLLQMPLTTAIRNVKIFTQLRSTVDYFTTTCSLRVSLRPCIRCGFVVSTVLCELGTRSVAFKNNSLLKILKYLDFFNQFHELKSDFPKKLSFTKNTNLHATVT